MKTFRLFLSIAFLISSFLSISASSAVENVDNFGKKDKAMACSVSNFVVTFMNCDLEYIVLNFDFSGTDFGLNGYTITSPEINFSQSFNINSSKYFILLADCMTSANFTITDNDDPNCSATFNYGVLCCPCFLYTDIDLSNCNNGTFDVSILIELYGSCIFFDPIITINNTVYQPIFSNGYYLISDVTINEPLIEYEICYTLNNNESYCESKTLANPCSSLDNFSVNVDYTNCNEDYIILPFSFNSVGLGQNGYTVTTSTGLTQTYSANDDFIFYHPADCAQPIIFTISDNYAPSFTQSFTIEPLCCPCILEYQLEVSNCLDSISNITLDLLNVEGSCNYYDNWLFTANGDTLDLFFDNGTYYYNGFHSTDTLLFFNLCSQVPGNIECYRDTIVNPCYQPNTNNPCAITDFSVTSDTTSCSGEVINLDFKVTGTDFGGNGYTVTTNTGFTQFFNPNDTSQFTLLADCDENIIIMITDANDSLCTAVDTIGTLCCPCDVNVAINQSDCMDGTFTSSFVINNIQGSCINYDWSLAINGQNYTLNPTNTGFAANGVTSNDSLLIYALCTLVPDLPYCFMDTLVNPCYQPNTNNPCAITNFSVTPDSTTCTGEVISLDFDVTGTDFGSNGYTVTTNTGFTQFFNPNDTTQFTLLADCDENIIVTITEANDSLCTAIDTIGTLCCPCDVDVTINQSDCVNGTFSSSFVINNIQGSCINYDWSLAINGQNYTLNTTNTGFAVNGVTSNDSLLIYAVCTLVPDLPYCLLDTLVNPCYQPNTNNPCAITNFSVTPDSTSCTGEVISLDFDVTGTDFGSNGYTVTTNTGFSQFFNPNDTTQFTLLADCDENIIVTITDANDSLCTDIDTIGALCCPCDVDMAITQSDCIDGTFTSSFVINNIQGSCINYDWSLAINGQNYTLNTTNTGFVVTGITSNDSLLIYEYCYLVPSQPECENITLVNPCFDSTVATKDLTMEDLLQITLVHGEHLSIFNKSENSLDFNIYSINGQLLESIKTLHSHNNISLDISNWPSGTYILKAFNQDQTISKKLININ
jgi:hypothetical protein